MANRSEDGNLHIWDTSTGCQLGDAIRLGNDWIWCVAYSLDGSEIISAGADRHLRVCDANLQSVMLDTRGLGDERVSDVTYCADGTRVAYADDDGTIRICVAATDELVQICRPLRETTVVLSVAFSPDGAVIASGNDDGTIQLYRVSSGKRIGTRSRGRQKEVSSVAFSPEGARIVSGHGDDAVRVWNAETSETLWSLTHINRRVARVAFSPDSKFVLSVGSRAVKIWDAGSGKLIAQRLHEENAMDAAFSPSGTHIVYCMANRMELCQIMLKHS